MMEQLNKMCETCARLNNGCNGTQCQVWTGCVRYVRDSAKALKQQKADALCEYKQAKEKYTTAPTNENWMRFCDKKRVCMLLGVRI